MEAGVKGLKVGGKGLYILFLMICGKQINQNSEILEVLWIIDDQDELQYPWKIYASENNVVLRFY